MPTVLVAVAGALGAVLRYRIGLAIGVRTFPWATLGINISGSFLLAFVLTGPAVSRWPTVTTTAVAVGFPRGVHDVLDLRVRDVHIAEG